LIKKIKKLTMEHCLA